MNYSKKNTDISLVNPVFKNLIANCNVEFRLATKDPNGNCTNGIEHIYSPLTNNADDASKLNTWDNKKYLNIWVVASINSSGVSGGIILGYAQFPWDNTSQPKTDGILVRADQIVSGNNTLTHEIGHYLGLMHTFETAMGVECGKDCSKTGDLICDTPPTAKANFGCTAVNSCTSDMPDMPDMIENYMDYSSCTHMFTVGQKERMDGFFSSSRASLITQDNLVATGTDVAPVSGTTTYCTPKADFYASTYTICQGSSVTFHDASYNSAVTSYKWTIAGGTPATSTSASPSISFSQAGTYTVELKVSNPAGTGDTIKKEIVTVLPSVADTKLPVSEDFENALPDGWAFSKDNTSEAWGLTSRSAYTGYRSIYLNNYNGTTGATYNATMPMMDMSTMKKPKLTFKYAYAPKSTTSTDLFKVQVNTGCGSGYFPNVFSKAAKLIATAPVTAVQFVPDTSQWKTLSIDLSAYQNVTNLIVRFSMTNGSGNNMYIDDINISGETVTGLDAAAEQVSQLTVYPNPASDNVTISIPSGL